MAEAGVESSSSSLRYFCHKCNDEIQALLPAYTCPRCNSGFIEAIEGQHDIDSDSSGDMDYEVWEVVSEVPHQIRTASEQSSSGGVGASASGPRRRQRIRYTINPRLGRQRNQEHQNVLRPVLQDFIVNMASGLLEWGPLDSSAPMPMFFSPSLASNPGDYAWGRGGLDAIITHLMNQLGGTGAPPLPQENINMIPTVKITQEQCDNHLQCSVCMEDFNLGDSVRKLMCEHCYHEGCIIPWLEMHATCPVCRKMLTNDFKPPDSSSTASTNISEGDVTIDGNSADDEIQAVIVLDDSISPQPSASRSSNNSRINYMEDELD